MFSLYLTSFTFKIAIFTYDKRVDSQFTGNTVGRSKYNSPHKIYMYRRKLFKFKFKVYIKNLYQDLVLLLLLIILRGLTKKRPLITLLTLSAALERVGMPSSYLPVSMPHANGDQVIAPIPTRNNMARNTAHSYHGDRMVVTYGPIA